MSSVLEEIQQDENYRKLNLDSIDDEYRMLASFVDDPELVRRSCYYINDCSALFDRTIVYRSIESIYEHYKSHGFISRSEIVKIIRSFGPTPEETQEFKQALSDVENFPADKAVFFKRVIDRKARREIFEHIRPENVLMETRTSQEALTELRESLLKIGRTSSIVSGRGGLLSRDYHENVKSLNEILERRDRLLLRTGNTRFDNICQFLPSSYNIIGARPSIGKTTAMLNLCLWFASQGIRCQFFTLEVDYDTILQIFSCIESGLLRRVIHEAPSQNTRSVLSESYERIHRLPIELYSGKTQSSEIFTQIEDGVTRDEDPVQVVFVDYLQIMRSRKSLSDIERLNMISEGFRVLKTDHQVCLFVAAQLNRKAADGKPPRLEDLKGTGDLEQDADSVILLDRPNKEIADSYNNPEGIQDDRMDFYIRKNRHGETGCVQNYFRKATGQITEMTEEETSMSQMAVNNSTSISDYFSRDNNTFNSDPF